MARRATATVSSPAAPDGDRSSPSLGALPTYLGYTIRRAQIALFRDFEQRMAALDVTPGQFSLLTLVDANPGISQVALARVHGLDKSTLTPAVDRLAQRGLIDRQRDPSDRRYYALALTEAGKRALSAVTERVEDQERVMADALSPDDAAQMIDALRRITRALDESS